MQQIGIEWKTAVYKVAKVELKLKKNKKERQCKQWLWRGLVNSLPLLLLLAGWVIESKTKQTEKEKRKSQKWGEERSQWYLGKQAIVVIVQSLLMSLNEDQRRKSLGCREGQIVETAAAEDHRLIDHRG